jgi:hypothetical protein
MLVTVTGDGSWQSASTILGTPTASMGALWNRGKSTSVFSTNMKAEAFWNGVWQPINALYDAESMSSFNGGFFWSNKPVGDAGDAQTWAMGTPLMLNSSGSHDPDSSDSITTFAWDLNNDGSWEKMTTSTILALTPSEAANYFSSVGLHQVGLGVVDTTGLWSSTVLTSVNTIPEPVSFIVWSMLGVPGVGLGWWRRRKQTET